MSSYLLIDQLIHLEIDLCQILRDSVTLLFMRSCGIVFQKLPTSQHWWVCIFLAHSVARHIYNKFLGTLSLSVRVQVIADSMICHRTYSWIKGRTTLYRKLQHFQQEQRGIDEKQNRKLCSTTEKFLNILYHFKFVPNER